MKFFRLPTAALAAAATLLTAASAHAQVLLQWNTWNNGGLEVIEPSVFNHASVLPADLLVGAGVNVDANLNRLGGSSWLDVGDTNPSTLAEAIPDNDYFQFTVTPVGGARLTLTSFVFNWERSGTGPNAVTLRWSLDEFASDLGSKTGLPAGLTTGNTITLTGTPELSGPVMLRLYGWGATALGGTGGFDLTVNAPNVQLNGLAVIPEPATYAYWMGFGSLLILIWRRRRRDDGVR